MKISSPLLLLLLLLGAGPLLAEPPKTMWRTATAEERIHVPAALSNLFFVFHVKKQIMAYAGAGNLDDAIISSEKNRKAFIDEIIAGIQRQGQTVKDQQQVTLNGVPATEVFFMTPATEQTMLSVFCIAGTRFITLCVISKAPLSFKDPEFQSLVKELPIKQAPPFRTDSGTELRSTDIAPIQ